MFRQMRRTHQALNDKEIIELLKQEKRGVLSIIGDHGYPYGLPMNYYYDENNHKIYFHSGKIGHKVDALKNNNKVCFCIYDQGYRKEGEWALNIKSVIVFGYIKTIENDVLDIYRQLSLKYTDDLDYIENEINVYKDQTLCYEMTIEYISGKLVNEA